MTRTKGIGSFPLDRDSISVSKGEDLIELLKEKNDIAGVGFSLSGFFIALDKAAIIETNVGKVKTLENNGLHMISIDNVKVTSIKFDKDVVVKTFTYYKW